MMQTPLREYLDDADANTRLAVGMPGQMFCLPRGD